LLGCACWSAEDLVQRFGGHGAGHPSLELVDGNLLRRVVHQIGHAIGKRAEPGGQNVREQLSVALSAARNEASVRPLMKP
jgi:hypothetical protein